MKKILRIFGILIAIVSSVIGSEKIYFFTTDTHTKKIEYSCHFSKDFDVPIRNVNPKVATIDDLLYLWHQLVKTKSKKYLFNSSLMTVMEWAVVSDNINDCERVSRYINKIKRLPNFKDRETIKYILNGGY